MTSSTTPAPMYSNSAREQRELGDWRGTSGAKCGSHIIRGEERRLVERLKQCCKGSNGSNRCIVRLTGRTRPCAEDRPMCGRLVVAMLVFVEDRLGGRNSADPDHAEDHEYRNESLPTTNHKSQPGERMAACYSGVVRRVKTDRAGSPALPSW